MCRFTLYLGPPVRLASLVTEPTHSLIRQSLHSRERKEPLNGDGFGVAWYAPRLTPEPGLFHAVTPAWSEQTLASLARVVASPCILAHVRAASPGSPVHQANCHPFAHGRYSLMHNGEIGGFRRLQRRIVEGLSDDAYDIVKGSTDSEHLLALFIDEAAAYKREAASKNGDAALALARTLSRAVARVLRITSAADPPARSSLNIVVSDGLHAAVCRFADHPDQPPESLYWLDGELYEPEGRRHPERRKKDEGRPVVVSSERLTDDPRWQPVPPNSMLVLDRRAEPRLIPMRLDGTLEEA